MSRADRPEMELRCPDCASPETALIDRNRDMECANCGARFERDSAFVTVADAEAYAERCAACTCDKVRGCPQCFQRADELVGALIRDSYGAEWLVENVDEKDGFPTIGGTDFWAWIHEVTVLKPPHSELGAATEARVEGGTSDGFPCDVDDRCAEPTNAVEYVGAAMRGRLDELRLLVLLSEGGRRLDKTQMLDVLELEGPADEGEIVDAATERLDQLPLCIQRTMVFEIVLGTGGPDDRLIVECDTERVGGMGNSALVTYEIRRILYRYSWSGSGEVVLSGEDFDTAEAFAREVVPELAQ